MSINLHALCSIVSEVMRDGYSTRPKRQSVGNSCRQMRALSSQQCRRIMTTSSGHYQLQFLSSTFSPNVLQGNTALQNFCFFLFSHGRCKYRALSNEESYYTLTILCWYSKKRHIFYINTQEVV